MTTAEILTKAAKLLDKPGVWVKYAFAKNSKGSRVKPSDPDACQFCMLGAIRHVSDNVESGDKAKKVVESLLCGSITSYNDYKSTSKDDAVHMLLKGAREADSR